MSRLLAALSELGGINDGLEEVFEELGLGLFVDHPEKGCIYCNAEVLRMFEMEWEEFRGFGWAKVVHPDDVETLRRAIERYELEKGTIEVRYRIRLPSGTERALDVVGRAVLDAEGNQRGSVMIGRDVSAERAERESRVNRHKLEAIGRLAGRLAHDFNNALTPMMFSLGMLEEAGLDATGREHLEILARESDHLASMTRELLSLSLQQSGATGTTELGGAIRSKEPLLRQVAGEQVELEFRLDEAEAWVPLGPHEVGQVVLNLVLNAREAVGERGRVVVRTDRDGADVRLCVEDDGCGMTPEVRARMFEPFFTTRGADRGTGLGLFSVKDLVERAGGRVEVETAPGAGTTISIALPCVAGSSAEARDALDAPELEPTRVLIVDDNAALRQTLAYVLALRGHAVETSSGLTRAERLFDEREFDVLVTDVLLQDGSGVDLAARVRERSPEFPIVFMTGFAGEEMERIDLGARHTAFLTKPFPVNRLLVALAEVLDVSANASAG